MSAFLCIEQEACRSLRVVSDQIWTDLVQNIIQFFIFFRIILIFHLGIGEVNIHIYMSPAPFKQSYACLFKFYILSGMCEITPHNLDKTIKKKTYFWTEVHRK